MEDVAISRYADPLLASVNRRGDISLWDRDSLAREQLPYALGQSRSTWQIAFSPVAQLLVGGALEGSIVLWDTKKRRPIGHPIQGHGSSAVSDVAISPDGRWLASSDESGMVLLWPLKIDVWRQWACQIANRELTRGEWSGYFGEKDEVSLCPDVGSGYWSAQAAQADGDTIQLLPPLRPRAPISVPAIIVGVNEQKPREKSVAANQDIQSATSGVACLDFDNDGDWGSLTNHFSVWDDQYAGWVPFAVDDGFYQIKNVVFAKEQSVGRVASFRIASSQPYAAGLVSPIIEVTPGATLTVTVSYYIGGPARDWVSMGVKGDASLPCGDGCYVNGYPSGQWATLTHTATSTTGKARVLLWAGSPQGMNSNIYFDDVRIQVDDKAIEDCRY